jgi:predicted ATPase
LRTTLTWSYDLLGPAEQTLFRRLAVFVGGWTLEAAETVADDAILPAVRVLDGLQALADSSLVQRRDQLPGEPRFDVLETVGEYALDRLDESGEAPVIRDRHLEYYLGLAEHTTLQLFGPLLPQGLASLDAELGNVRAALDWASERGQIATGLRLAGALAPFWSTRGYAGEGLAWLNRLLAEMEPVTLPAAVAARTLYGAGVLANSQGDQQRAMQWLDRAIELYREAGDQVGAIRALNTRSGVDYDWGDLQSSMQRLKQCTGLARAANDLGELARALANLGEVYYHLDDLDRAAQCHQEALRLARRAGRVDIEAYQLSDLANVARRRADYATATRLHRQALGLKRMLGDHRRIAISLEDLAALAVAEGDMQRAARWLGTASELRARIGSPLPVPERIATERTVATAQAALGQPGWSSAFTAGRLQPLAEVIADALGESGA